MQVTLLSPLTGYSEAIIQSTRICYDSYAKQNEESDAKLLRHLVRNDESPLEFANFRFFIEGVSRVFSHQLVRHRLSSFAQRSQRYVNEEGFEFVTPPSLVLDGENKVAAGLFHNCMKMIETTYEALCAEGIKNEDARFVLPNSCHTKIIYQANLRSLRNFWRERLNPKAQWEIRAVALETLRFVHKIDPNLTISKDNFFESCLK